MEKVNVGENDEVLIIALNFSDHDNDVAVPFGHNGVWVDILEASYDNVNEPYSISVSDSSIHELVSIPGNFGRIFRLES